MSAACRLTSQQRKSARKLETDGKCHEPTSHWIISFRTKLGLRGRGPQKRQQLLRGNGIFCRLAHAAALNDAALQFRWKRPQKIDAFANIRSDVTN
jgi:hypothetical protein